MKIPPDYRYLIEEKYFTEKQIFGRMLFWAKTIRAVIETYKLEKFVRVDDDRLLFMLLCYFSDIARLKKFHHIETTHEVKVFAYSFYWFLRAAPIQIISELPEEKESQVSLNEVVVLGVWCFKFLLPLKLETELRNRYITELQYFIKYRSYTAQTFEAMLNALLVGAGKNPFYDEAPDTF